MEPAVISVIIPTHNRPALLRRAIASVLAQTCADWELLVMGDGAGPLEMPADPRIRYVDGPRQSYPPGGEWLLGGTAAFNRGLDLARGEWVTGLGDDDELPPDALSCLLRGTGDVVYGRAEVVGHGMLGKYPPECGSIQSAMWKRNDYRYNLTRTDAPADWALWSAMLDAGLSFGFVPEIVYRYHPNAHVPKVEPLVVAVIPTRFRPDQLPHLLDTLRKDGVIPLVLDSEQYGHRIYAMWNAGLREARELHPGCVVAVLNDDIWVAPGAIPQMAGMLLAHADVGVVYPDWHGNDCPAYLVPTTGGHPQGGMTGFAFLFRETLPLDFDESYRWWYGDNDFEERVRGLGLQVCRATGVPVRHSLDGSAQRVWGEIEPLVAADRALWTERHP
jgi:hypothetical protein